MAIFEVQPCNTTRPDDSSDGLTCDGSALDFAGTEHVGWIQNSLQHLGRAYSKNGSNGGRNPCEVLPVWCCWVAESTE